MKRLSWKKYFRPHILERGENYAHEGQVTDLSDSNGKISAEVEGSETYDVEIEYAGNKILSMYCSCPYAESGESCKHMAAVLYAWEDESAPVNDTNTELEEAINAMEVEKLRKILLNAAQKDSTLAALICPPKKQQKRPSSRTWKREIASGSKRYGGRDGFVDYDHAWDYAGEISDILDFYSDLLEMGCPEEAFRLSCEIFDEICTIDIDDSDGQLTVLLSACCDAWDDILAAADDALKGKMHEWFAVQWKNGTCWDDQLISQYVFSTCTSEEKVRNHLEYLDGKIAESQSDYALDGFLRQKLELLEKLPDKERAIKAFFEEYGSIASVRAMFAERMLRQGDTDGAIVLLRQNKENPEKGYYASAASEKLIEIFTQSGDTENLITELTDYVMTFRQNNLQYIERLKVLLPESEWAELREKLLGKLEFYLKNRLLFSEGLLRRLLDSIINANSVGEMDQYAAFLRSDYSDEVRDFYYDYLQNSAKVANDRKMYRKLMTYLRKLSECPGGRALARQLAAEWKQEYQRRPAMMDELRKAGY